MEQVDIKVNENVATIVIDRPEVHNALNASLVHQLTEAFGDIHQEKRVTAVVLTGKGDHFCSGVDLKDFAKISVKEPIDAMPEWLEAWQQLTELCETLLRFPKPVIAAVDGGAIGAGLAVALSCDLLVMSKRAELIANAAQRGLIGGLTAPLLEFRIGSAIASRMLLTGEPMPAEEAFTRGLCCQVTDADQVWVTANDWAKRCGQAPRESIQATKRMLNESIGETLLTNLAAGAASGATLCSTDSAAEGISAFVEKRAPQWP
ncbi:enoyl-CoA hydratase/isomerase family protein [Roseiconus lacunae]|uniref:Enoyl-CoA hydratase/isomerase family protein n=1 Tax=Roseiconus lacunae TaxID=2605694 RepID=A0ABT7PMI3_9BACT|nr:enoyl-CoA hydratase/isomerase family protein [Roseiconus lacunae]MCD0463395.1 enoyl-CoA hydratase/isomerase family protein [Roseiconus lacunae]MDM4017727.1 enoyl-CoA hydratase/isomerase family protein [Roseiconus lacunae]WRQ48519.1 enoyl-CoA hydratase/isomerase family protein [Stieleria sp. HD01]